MTELNGLRTLVTGSTRGIGQAIALALAQAGADVIVHGRSDTAEAVDAITKLGHRSTGLQADLRNLAACDRLVDEAWEKFGGIDVWVNNAGADILTGDAAHWAFGKKLEVLFEVDVRATIHLSRAVGERMLASGGSIINIGWDQADTGMAGDTGQLFAVSKGAVMAFSKSLAVTLAPKVRVNCIAPGWIKTAWGETASAVWQERVKRDTPLQRWGTPEDVAAAAVWLASPAASFITGQVIRVNGGVVR
jgi:3-oxoacyl-[acyl-carrier protein] reductase